MWIAVESRYIDQLARLLSACVDDMAAAGEISWQLGAGRRGRRREVSSSAVGAAAATVGC